MAAENSSVEQRLLRIKAAIDTFPDFPKPGIIFKDIFSVLRNVDLFRDLIDIMVETLRPQKCDVIVALEARGFLFGPPVALALGVPFVPIRKKGKLPGDVAKISYQLEYGVDIFEMQTSALTQGQSVVIIDDLLATGGTMNASCQLVTNAGASVSCCLVVMELTELRGRDHIRAPVISLITI